MNETSWRQCATQAATSDWWLSSSVSSDNVTNKVFRVSISEMSLLVQRCDRSLYFSLYFWAFTTLRIFSTFFFLSVSSHTFRGWRSVRQFKLSKLQHGITSVVLPYYFHRFFNQEFLLRPGPILFRIFTWIWFCAQLVRVQLATPGVLDPDFWCKGNLNRKLADSHPQWTTRTRCSLFWSKGCVEVATTP